MVSLDRLSTTLEEIRAAGLYKTERIITTPQSVEVKVQGSEQVLNFCGLSVASRIDTLLEPSFSVAISARPSPLKSCVVIARGLLPTL